jgi:uncharacterized lipoprotein YehR (DUF1307 family)
MKVENNTLTTLVVVLLIVLIAGCGTNESLEKEDVSIVNSADGSSIAYGVRGQGDFTLVFVHCWTCNLEFRFYISVKIEI